MLPRAAILPRLPPLVRHSRSMAALAARSIALAPEEAELFALLLSVLDHFRRTTVLRVAGGWVRDKLLGKESHDIDIALDDMAGIDFANMVNDYLAAHGMQTRTIAVIQANPDQSKHLETANLRVLGFEIDCVNLRAETYADTRIPEVRIGTAHEDALRRDFTINALFYNIRDGAIEDFTAQGLDDLGQKYIRTPLSPFVTFKDDPLRILRAIRFSSRLHFHLCPELCAAARNPEIKEAFLTKVSRERVYKEVEGMIIHPECRPAIGFALLYKLNVLDGVLPVHQLVPLHTVVRLVHVQESVIGRLFPSDWDVLACWQEAAIEAVYYVDILLHMRHSTPRTRQLLGSVLAAPHPVGSGNVKALYWCAIVYALAEVVAIEKKKEIPFYHILLRDGVKMENSTMRQIQLLIECSLQFAMLTPSTVTLDVAHLLRHCKDLWRDAVLLACAIELASLYILHKEDSMAKKMDYDLADVELTVVQMEVIDKFRAIEEAIDALDLDRIWELKPLLDGSELIKALALPKGPAVGKALEEQAMWQIRTRSSDREQCLAHMSKWAATLAPCK